MPQGLADYEFYLNLGDAEKASSSWENRFVISCSDIQV